LHNILLCPIPAIAFLEFVFRIFYGKNGLRPTKKGMGAIKHPCLLALMLTGLIFTRA